MSSHSILLTNRGFKVFSSDFFVDALAFISLFTIAVFAVYPAASLVDYAPYDCLKFLIDPSESVHIPGVEINRSNAGTGVPLLVERLLAMDLN